MTPQEELQALRASKRKKQLTPLEELKQLRKSKNQSALGISRAPSFQDVLKSTSGKDEQMFDYTTGAKGRIRAALSFMETPEEKEDLLRQQVGEDGFTKDSAGRLALTPKGQARLGYDPIEKNLIIEEEGFRLGRDLADVAGLAPETIGSIIGGIIGAPTLIGGAVGAGLGAAAGQTIEEGIEKLFGVQKQTGREVAIDAAKEAALAGTIDLATMGTYKAIRGLVNTAGKGANAAAKAMGTTQRELTSEQAEQALRLLDKNAMPSYEAAGMPAGIARGAQITEAISGGREQRAVKNVLFALNEKKRILDEAGAATIDDLAGVIKNSAPQKAKSLQDKLASAQKAHMKAIDDSLNVLTQSTLKGSEVDDFVLKTLTDNYEKFLTASDANWKGIDEILDGVRGQIKVNGETIEATGGELPIFDIAAFKTKFDDVIRSEYGGSPSNAPDEFLEIGQIMNELSNKSVKKGFTSFNGMKNLRKNIHDRLMDPKLSLGNTTARRLLSDIEGRIDDIMYGKTPIKITGVGRGRAATINKDKINAAMKQLEIARKDYAKEIGMYQQLEKLNILRNLGEPGKDVKLTVGRFFDDIIKTPNRIKAVLEASKGNKDSVRKALSQKYIEEAMDIAKKGYDDPLEFSGLKFYNKIADLKKSGAILFGDDWDQVQKIARSLSLGGVKKLDDATLQRIVAQNPSDNIVTTLQSIRDAQINLDEALSTKVLRDLTQGVTDPEEAAAVIVKPSTTRAQMNRIMKFFENDPKAQDTIRRTIVNDILKSVDEDIFLDEKAAYSLKKAISSYKPEMLERVLGKQTLSDMKELADDLIFLRDSGKKGAGSLAADAVRTGVFTNPAKNLGKIGRFKILNYLFNNPQAMRTALELKTGRTTPQQAAKSWSQAMNESIGRTTEEGATVGQRAAGAAQTLGNILSGINRGQVATRQGVGQLLTSPQQVRGTPPEQPRTSRTTVPKVLPPVNADNLQVIRQVNPRYVQQQQSIRERARTNPYVAASLLGGLGSAGLL